MTYYMYIYVALLQNYGRLNIRPHEMSAILDLWRKRGFAMSGLGWEIFCALMNHQ